MTRALLALLLLAGLAGCGHPDQADLRQLEQFRTAPDASVAQASIACDSVDPACARLWLYKGAACARLAEAPSEGQRSAMRACAVSSFRQARTLAAKDPADQAAAMKGLANALKLTRDNDSPLRAEATQELTALLPALRATPDGAPYAGYFQADLLVNDVLAGKATGPAACQALREASASLPGDPLPADLRTRVPALRSVAASQGRSRGCV